VKLVTFTDAGGTRAGVLTPSGDIADAEAPMLDLLADGTLVERAEEALLNGPVIPASQTTLQAPIPRPGKVLAIGLNYRDHAEESGQPIPQRPVVFTKATTCIVGPGAPIHIPRVSGAVDWEAELCFVIGKPARYVKATDAAEYVAGYCIGNDVSVRDWQFHSPTWVMGKSFDTHGPIGPWLVTRDEVGKPRNLDIRLTVNGEEKQRSNTSQLIFGIGEIIEYLSAGMTLEPGDVVFTGTPAGIGGARKPPEWLKEGDAVQIEITGLGVLENPVVGEPA
jgi:2-keto-4-pentenoate hydratase/2-oxohepta-3-ene-1,7-dioic acid hydratase in catechol pathway